MTKPTGQGMWIWQISACEGGDIGRIVAKAKQIGLGHVLIKVADAEKAYNEPKDSDLVTALLAAGIEPWAWVYTYPTGPEGEAEWHATQFLADQFAGLIVDAEKEYAWHGQAATAYAKRLRELLPEATLGFTSYWSPVLHPEIPWAQFLSTMDLNLPQVYWYGRDPVATVRKSFEENRRLGVPVLPIGGACADADGMATPATMRLFAAEMRAQGYSGWSWWEWSGATDAMWRAIAEVAGGKVLVPSIRPLAEVAAEAPGATWMRQSYAVNSSGTRKPLATSAGYCSAWAGECLAHAYDPTAGANARHTQKHFAYAGIADTAHNWGAHLRRGGDADLGEWIGSTKSLQPGDMIFWLKGVNGYAYAAGHVAIVTSVSGSGVHVSENSTSRGIGVHALPTAALANAAGVMRWDLPQEQAPAPAPQPDVAPWAEAAASRLVAAGIIEGGPDGKLHGYDEVTRNELFVALDRALNG